MISALILKFSYNALKAAEFWFIVGLTAVLHLLQKKAPLLKLFNQQFLLLLSERGLSPESSSAIAI